MSVLTAFASHCRTNAYALWAGTWDYYAFMDAMIPEVENGYQAAWREALAAHGMELEDATEEEERYVADAQAQASSHLNDLGEWIELHARDGEEPLLLAAIHGRIDLWVNNLQRLITWANAELAGNEKLRWDYGATEAHCEDCAKYVGRVYRARAWARVGALPQARELACGGWRCDCRLTPTTERANKGFPPRPSGRMHELAEWDDASHPRDENGRFASGGGGASENDAIGAGNKIVTSNQSKQGKSVIDPSRVISDTELLDTLKNFKSRTVEDEWGDPMDRIICVRWTTKPECGTDRLSINHQTGASELGLSVNKLAPVPREWQGDEKKWMEMQIRDYSFLPGRPYIMIGWSYRDARGSDNEPLIEASTSKLLGIADYKGR